MASRHEIRLESDDAVRRNIDTDLLCVFEAIKRSIKASDRITRTEVFLQWCEENPGEVVAIQAEYAARSVDLELDRVADKPAGDACARCPGRRAVCVPPEYASRAKLVIVGEGPGKNELREGRPFVGRSGKMLERGLATLGLSRADVHWTNAVLCDVSPTQLHAARRCCEKRLAYELIDVGAPVVVPVGACGLQSTLGTTQRTKILDWRGSITRKSLGAVDTLVAPTVHPAFVMRMPQWGPVLEADFERVGRVLRDDWCAPEERDGVQIVVVESIEQLAALLPSLATEVAIDVETVGLGPTHTRLVCLAISDTKLSLVVPWTSDAAGKCAFWRGRMYEVAQLFTDALATRVAVTHNGPAFDHIVLARYGIKIKRWDDTLLMAHAAHSHLRKRLEFVTQLYADVPPWKTYDHATTMAALWRYNGRDSLYTAMIAEPLRQAMREADQEKIYAVDKRTADLCRRMQTAGFRVDRTRAEGMASRLAARESEIESACTEVLGHPINLLSPTQLREAFFGRGGLGARVCYRSEKTGQPSLNVDVMRAYTASPNDRLARFASHVLEYRRCRKVRIGNLINPLKQLDSHGRIHATWMNYGACSGRFSCQAPNLMNLPRAAQDPTIVHGCGNAACAPGRCACRCELCGGVRSVYVAAPNYTLLSPDAKQLEMRVAAYASGDPVMIAACESADLHAANAEIIFESAFTNGSHSERRTLRDITKSAGYAVCYRAEAHTVYEYIIAMGVSVTLRQVEAMLRKMRTKFRQYYAWQDAQYEEICRTGYVYESVTGRRRWLGTEAPSATEAANFPIQSGAAGLMNTKLPAIVDEIDRLHLPARLIAQGHDAATFETRNDAVDAVRALYTEIFEAPIEIGGRKCSFPVDWKIGERWA